MALPVPAGAEFNVVSVANPYGCNELGTLSMYRRPLPSTNLRYLSTVMWDGRESSPQTGTQKITPATYPGDLMADLAHQALDATNGHAQGSLPLTPQQQQAIVAFEMGLSTAQVYSYAAGLLSANGAAGGPETLAEQTGPAFFIGINDPLGGNPKGLPFTPTIFRLFDAWASHRTTIGRRRLRPASRAARQCSTPNPSRLTVSPGSTTICRPPPSRALAVPVTIRPNVGNHSVSAPLNIGVGDVNSSLNVSYLPVIKLQNKTTHEIKITTDPGRALITGVWKDVGRMKGPVLRGLASRAPYFHNGSADTSR